MLLKNKTMFARWGDMNRHHYGVWFDKEGNKLEPTFHTPPVHRGIYAFIWPYIEPFLAAWNDKVFKETDKLDEYGYPKKKFIHIKKFTHIGEVWCHFVEEAQSLRLGKKYIGSWALVDAKDLSLLLKKIAHVDTKALGKGLFGDVRNPYKKGQGGNMSRDHLEVFIENVKENRRY